MKNTKHTEMNDSSIEQDNQENLSQSKRKILTSIGVTSGVVGASALVPSTWVKPAVNSIILPAHAQSTPVVGTTPGSMMGTSPDPDPDPDPMMGTTTPAPVEAAIVLSTMAITLTEGGPPDDVVEADKSATYTVMLSTSPAEDEMVVVTVTAPDNDTQGISIQDAAGDTVETLTFTMDENDPQEVTVTSLESDVTPENAGDNEIKIYHSSLGYTTTAAVVTVTIVDKDLYKGDFGDTNVDVKGQTPELTPAEIALYGKVALDDGELLVNWTPTVGAQVKEYVVQIRKTSAITYDTVGTYGNDVTTTGILALEDTTGYTVRVIVVYEDDSEASGMDTGLTNPAA